MIPLRDVIVLLWRLWKPGIAFLPCCLVFQFEFVPSRDKVHQRPEIRISERGEGVVHVPLEPVHLERLDIEILVK